MENPRTTSRLLVAILIAFAIGVFAAGVYLGNSYVLLCSLVMILILPIWFGLVAVLNVIVFAPLFWLMAKFTGPAPKVGKSNGKLE